MKLKIAHLCSAYDQAQSASRDPTRRDDQEYFLKILDFSRGEIKNLVDSLQSQIAQESDVSDDCRDRPVRSSANNELLLLAELTYFNTWLHRRGGWVGSEDLNHIQG